MLTILTYPNPVLREISEPIDEIDDNLRALAEEMIETMYEADGVGLAAPQIGVSRRLIVIDINPDERDPQVLINPVITSKSKTKEAKEEGCLSVPGINAKVTRPESIKAEALTLHGETVHLEGGGLLARCLQHEIDHLDGILFIDKVSLAAKLSLKGELKALEPPLS